MHSGEVDLPVSRLREGRVLETLLVRFIGYLQVIRAEGIGCQHKIGKDCADFQERMADNPGMELDHIRREVKLGSAQRPGQRGTGERDEKQRQQEA